MVKNFAVLLTTWYGPLYAGTRAAEFGGNRTHTWEAAWSSGERVEEGTAACFSGDTTGRNDDSCRPKCSAAGSAVTTASGRLSSAEHKFCRGDPRVLTRCCT
jgi:hypothetical protein